MFVMPPLEGYLERHGDTTETRLTYYQTYLYHTDYVAAKLAEALYYGQRLGPEYDEILAKRKEARTKINELEESINE